MKIHMIGTDIEFIAWDPTYNRALTSIDLERINYCDANDGIDGDSIELRPRPVLINQENPSIGDYIGAIDELVDKVYDKIEDIEEMNQIKLYPYSNHKTMVGGHIHISFYASIPEYHRIRNKLNEIGNNEELYRALFNLSNYRRKYYNTDLYRSIEFDRNDNLCYARIEIRFSESYILLENPITIATFLYSLFNDNNPDKIVDKTINIHYKTYSKSKINIPFTYREHTYNIDTDIIPNKISFLKHSRNILLLYDTIDDNLNHKRYIEIENENIPYDDSNLYPYILYISNRRL